MTFIWYYNWIRSKQLDSLLKNAVKPSIATVLFGLLLAACSPRLEQRLAGIQLPAATSPLLVVLASDWDSSSASLQRFEKQSQAWRAIGEPIPVRIGRNGLGWGLGLHQAGKDGVQKQEGDGKAPAGLFILGTAFGYAPTPPQSLRMPYRWASERDYFVDAVDSSAYNQWQTIPIGQPNEPKQHWHSFERMQRDDHQYEYGLVVGHNQSPITPGRGSAIFLHVWLNPDTPTSGCTAMSKDNLLTVLNWLKPEAQPLLIQLPNAELDHLQWAG